MEKSIEFTVARHEILLRWTSPTAGYGTQGEVVLYNDDQISRTCSILFVSAQVTVPAPSTRPDPTHAHIEAGTIVVSSEFIPFVLDLLRNESTLSVYLDLDHPDRNSIYTKNWSHGGVTS